MDIHRIHPEDIDEVWEFIEPLTSNNKMLNNWVTSNYLYNLLVNNKADLWVNMDLTAFCIGATYSRIDNTKTYIVEYMTSDVSSSEGWNNTIKPIEEQAKEWGCSTIEVKGRKGWHRVLPEYKLKQITLEKQLC
jgi:hypothetical protein